MNKHSNKSQNIMSARLDEKVGGIDAINPLGWATNQRFDIYG